MHPINRFAFSAIDGILFHYTADPKKYEKTYRPHAPGTFLIYTLHAKKQHNVRSNSMAN